MKKYATSVIIQGSSKNGRTSAQRAPSPRTDGPVAVAPANRVRPPVDAVRGYPSPKSSHTSSLKIQRRSPHSDIHEEHQRWLSLSGSDHIQSTDAEQQSMLASVLEPEQHHKLKKLVDVQKHHSFSRPNKSVNTSAAPTPSKPIMEEDHAGTDDDGVMSSRTQATSQLWSVIPPEDSLHALSTMESSLQNMSVDELMGMNYLVQREMERRGRATSTSISSPILPTPPSTTSTPVPTPVAPPSSNFNTANFVDQQAIQSRKDLKRSKSGGNESAFNPRSRTPQPKTSVGTANGANFNQHNGRPLELPLVEKDDPELLSVHSDVPPHGSHGVSASSQTVNGSGASSSSSSAMNSVHPQSASSSTNMTNGIINNNNSNHNNNHNQTSSSNGNRPVSRTNGALHPHDKMLYGHCNPALPCLSPMDQTQSPLDFNLNSRSSSRPPSRGVTLPNFEDRLSSSLGGSQSLGGNMLTAASLALASEAMMPIEVINISNAPTSSAMGAAATLSTTSATRDIPLDQFIASNSAALMMNVPMGMQREVSRSELVLSPHSAFDDFSVGSQSVNSSLSSRQNRRPRRRDTQTSTSTASSLNHFSYR